MPEEGTAMKPPSSKTSLTQVQLEDIKKVCCIIIIMFIEMINYFIICIVKRSDNRVVRSFMERVT